MWADLYDDVGGFTDRYRYREAIYHIFILGEEPPKYDDDDDDPKPPGAKKTLSKPQLEDRLAQARAIRERAIQKRAEKAE